MKLKVGLIWLAVVILAVAGGYYYWLENIASQLPDGIVSSNGRIEAGQVRISVKRAGRVTDILVREGDMVDAGDVVARMDVAEQDAEMRVADAQVLRAEKGLEEAIAASESHESQLEYSKAELARTRKLHERGYASTEKLDQRLNEFQAAEASLRAAQASVARAEAALSAAREDRSRLAAILSDFVLKAPIRGRVQYRLAEPGEVLAAGGNVLTLIDLADVYMTVFLPSVAAGRVAIGSEARIVPDPAPDLVIPATVSFVSPDAQFTPKVVETTDERSKLVFRAKLRIDPALLRQYEDQVKAGVRGAGYVRTDTSVPWPSNLTVRLPE